MRHAFGIQTVSSLLVVAAFVASEMAAWFLAAYPTSGLAWRLNMGVFHGFELARTGSRSAGLLFGPASLPVACALLPAVAVAGVSRSRFLVALIANLSFLATIYLMHATCGKALIHNPGALVRSMGGQDGGVLLVTALAAASFTGFAASHWSFACAIFGSGRARSERRAGLAAAMTRYDLGVLQGGAVL